MGDRAQVRITEGDKEAYLYTHWRGNDLPEIIRQGLIVGRGRWDDPPYLTRILFCKMIEGERPNMETGFGISPNEQDSEYAPFVINTREQTVIIGDNVLALAEYIKEPKTWE